MSADFWAGYVSGALGILVGNPLDIIKVRLQAGPKPSAVTAPTVASSNPHTIREALRGLPAPVLTYGALNALLFMSYNRSLAVFPPTPIPSTEASSAGALAENIRYPYYSHFIAGALAGLATFVISTPTELVKCRAQAICYSASAPPYPETSSWSIAKQTFRTSGIPGLYEGGVVTSVRDAVGYGFYFTAYEVSKDLWDAGVAASNITGDDGGAAKGLGQRADSGQFGAMKILLCGGVAGIATWASIFPLDVIKTRVQTQRINEIPRARCALPAVAAASQERTSLLARDSPQRLRVSAVKVALEAYRKEGLAVFFRGITVCCVRAFIVNAVQWTTYEYMMRLFV